MCIRDRLPVIWFALLTAPYISHGLFYVIEYLPEAMRNPFKIELCRDSLKTCLLYTSGKINGLELNRSVRNEDNEICLLYTSRCV